MFIVLRGAEAAERLDRVMEVMGKSGLVGG